MIAPRGVVESARAACLQYLDVFVLAGGLGTRLQPVLGDVPKLLAPVGTRPYLAYLLDWLRSFGARRIVFGLGHRAESIRNYFSDNPHPDLKLETIVEPQPLGTAGAVRFARAQLRTNPVLVLNGDSYVDTDLCEFLAHHRAAGKSATILCADVDDAGRYGRVPLDGSGSIRGFVEKDSTFGMRATINAGVYLLSAALLDDIAAGDVTSLERDVFERLPPGALAAFPGGSDFIDIGTPASLAEAFRILRRLDGQEQAASS
jgi:NDP-sugar pyrophosphorylase family protein